MVTLVQRHTQVLGEGALSGAVEAGNPHADLVLSAGLHGKLHLAKQPLELLFDVLGDDVFGDLAP
jgi:succinylglutamate desuccinylase